MLLEFRVRNFRTFRDETSLSLVASADKSLALENTTATGLPQPSRAVRAAAIYGANASGKTNLLRALGLMRQIVVDSAGWEPDRPLPFQPFRLDSASISEPTLFEVTIVLAGVRHQYGFEFNAGRILAEWHLVYRTARPQRWIDRVYDPAANRETMDFSAHLSGPKSVWQQATRANALLLSTAARLNSESLRPLFQWFSSSLNVFLDGGHIEPSFTVSVLQDQSLNREVTKLLNAADIAISGIATEKRKGRQRQIPVNLLPDEFETRSEEVELLQPVFEHTVGPQRAIFGLADESLGTQKLFALAGPLLDVLSKGTLLVIDEMDRSLHPLLVRQLMETFQNPEINRHGAQLIFSTHDTSLLDTTLLRRDQIWFVEKDASQRARLVPLSDFSPRAKEALEKGYLSGRYGGIPILDTRLVKREASAER